jgi:hypothetical protein
MNECSPRYSLIVEWDADAQVWCGYSDRTIGAWDEIHGLVIEAPTLAELFHEAAVVAPELMRLNGQPCPPGGDG